MQPGALDFLIREAEDFFENIIVILAYQGCPFEVVACF